MPLRREVMLRLYPGLSIPIFFRVTGCYYEIQADEAWVFLYHPSFPETPEGCRPERFWTIESLFGVMKLLPPTD